MKRATVLVAIVLVVTSAIAPVAASSSPSGMVTLPDSNVHENYASGGPPDGLPSAAAFRGSVMGGKHADTLNVTVTTGDRVAGPDGEPVGRPGELALVLRDDVHHDGRRVAVPVAALRKAFGHVPEAAHGLHESGSEWTAPIEQSGQLAVFRVPGFSTQTVTFSGEINATGTYTDGSSVTYDLSDMDAVEDSSFVINVTGSFATEWDNETETDLASDANQSLAIAGSHDPVGPSADDRPVLEVTGALGSYTHFGSSDDNDRNYIGKDGNGNLYKSAILYDDPPRRLTGVEIDQAVHNAEMTFDVYVVEGSSLNGNYGEGTQVASGVTSQAGTYTVMFDTPINISDGTSQVTVEFVTTSSPGGTNNQLKMDTTGSEHYQWTGSSTYTSAHHASVSLLSEPLNVSAAADDGTTASFGDLAAGETKTAEFGVSRSATSINWTGNGGALDVTLRLQERQNTTAGSVGVNNNSTSFPELMDGETTSLTANESWIQLGTNRVNVTLNTSGLSTDAPTPEVVLEYRHGARDDQSVTYEAEKWSERYNVSRTWSAEQENAQLEIPFASNVVAIRSVEKRVNGSSWTTLSSSEYTLDGTTATIDLGTAKVNETIEVRAVGSKVQVHNGAIEVLEPTTTGAALDTKVEITSWASDAYIDVSGTPDGERLHYTTTETWSDPSEYALYTAGGGQHLYLPNAGAGQTARVTTIPLGVIMHSGDAKLWVTDPDEAVFEVRPGPDSLNDKMELRYYDVTEGESYELYSKDEESPLTTNEAGSAYVEFIEDDLEDTLLIQLAGSSSSGGETGGGGSWDQAARNTPIENLATIGGIGGLVIMLVYGTGKAGVYGRQRWGLVGGTLVAGVLVSLEMLRPGAISQQIGAALGEVTPIAGLAAVGVVTYSVVTWWQARKQAAATPETEVSFNLRGGNGD